MGAAAAGERDHVVSLPTYLQFRTKINKKSSELPPAFSLELYSYHSSSRKKYVACLQCFRPHLAVVAFTSILLTTNPRLLLENVGCICNVVMGREICKSVLGNFHRKTFWRDCGEELSSLEKSWRRTKSLPISKATNRPPRQSLFSGLSFQIWSNLIKFATC